MTAKPIKNRVDPGFWIAVAMLTTFLCAKYLGIL